MIPEDFIEIDIQIAISIILEKGKYVQRNFHSQGNFLSSETVFTMNNFLMKCDIATVEKNPIKVRLPLKDVQLDYFCSLYIFIPLCCAKISTFESCWPRNYLWILDLFSMRWNFILHTETVLVQLIFIVV